MPAILKSSVYLALILVVSRPRVARSACDRNGEYAGRLGAGLLGQSVTVGVDDSVDAVADPEFGQDMGDMRLHGLFSDEQDSGDLGVAQSVGEEE